MTSDPFPYPVRPPFNSPNITTEQTFTAARTFLRVPAAREAIGADAAVLGIPFDIATSNRPGARFGPDAIRAASAQLAELKAYPGGFDPLQHVSAVDLGDVYLDYGHPQALPAIIEAAAARVIATGAFLISLGGDHFISYPLLKAHAAKFGPLALIQFDAHTDTWRSPAGAGDGVELNHGTMFARAIDEGLIVPERSVQIGIRTWVDDCLGMNIVDNARADEMSAGALSAAIRDIAGSGPAYITVDIDCLDPAYAPGTGTPVTGGLSPLKLLQTLRGLGSLNVIGFDIVEVAPPYDHGGITALNAATIVYEQICTLAKRRGAEATAYPPPKFS
jgi:agmatinase